MATAPSKLSASDINDRLRAQFGPDISKAEETFGDAVVTVSPARYREMVQFLRAEPDLAFDFFDFLAGVDNRPRGGGFEVVLDVYSTRHTHNMRLKVECDAENPRLPTISDIWAGANWHERETWELMGIVFDGHPHLVKLLLPEQFEGFPLRKDFALMSREAKPWPGEVEGEEVEE
jgi:NADH-quinone oxidoreductase subunit C